MAFREVRVFEVREVLRLWLRGEGFRATERLAGVDRKTVRRYVAAAVELGVVRDGGEGQLSDELIGSVVEAVRPHRVDGHGDGWRLLVANHDVIVEWLKNDGLTVRKAHELLGRRGVVVPERTLHRYALEVCDVGRGRRGSTMRVADGEPGGEVQIDFGRLGLVSDPAVGRCRVCHALVFTPVVSRYSFVWLSFRQTIDDVIAGCEAAWAFFGGVFATVIPDNMKAIVERSDSLEPRLNQAFVEYAQSRGFVIDPARVRSPQDKPRVERVVPFVRQSFFAGEAFVDLTDAQRRAETWCRERAGMRIHGTIQARPVEVFRIEEQSRLRPAPTASYDVPIYTTAKVHRDHHIEVAKALYSNPGELDRPAGRGARRPHVGPRLRAGPAGQGSSTPTARGSHHRS
jgi:transposase